MEKEFKYAGAGVRFKAVVLDALFILPLVVLVPVLLNGPLIVFMGVMMFGLAVSVYLFVFRLKKYGGSPGKRLVKIRVIRTDGKSIGFKEAVLRNADEFSIGLLRRCLLFYAMVSSIVSQSGMPVKFFVADYGIPKTDTVMNYIRLVWTAADIISLTVDKKHRSLKDFIAGTVVVHD